MRPESRTERTYLGNRRVKVNRNPHPSGPVSGLSAQYRGPACRLTGCGPIFKIWLTKKLIGTDHSSSSQSYVDSVLMVKEVNVFVV